MKSACTILLTVILFENTSALGTICFLFLYLIQQSVIKKVMKVL